MQSNANFASVCSSISVGWLNSLRKCESRQKKLEYYTEYIPPSVMAGKVMLPGIPISSVAARRPIVNKVDPICCADHLAKRVPYRARLLLQKRGICCHKFCGEAVRLVNRNLQFSSDICRRRRTRSTATKAPDEWDDGTLLSCHRLFLSSGTHGPLSWRLNAHKVRSSLAVIWCWLNLADHFYHSATYITLS